MNDNLIRDLLEGLMVLAVGGILFSSFQRLRHGKISVFRCDACERPTSRAYVQCPHCGAALAAR